ncbi:MAG: hypothetical protein CL608_12505 [Anaerolineaceae bacterium]|nr:hypothetical protein [Anaerolineaceae bacterium]
MVCTLFYSVSWSYLIVVELKKWLATDEIVYVLSRFQTKRKNFQNSLQGNVILHDRDVSHIGESQIKTKPVIDCRTLQLFGKEIA